MKFCYNCCDFIANSKKMLSILKEIKKIAKSEATVLIEGETGSGKEILACIIQKESKRASKPFFKINCSAIPLELFEAELFGYDKGAFTGAFKSRKGLIRAANGGTVLLDEISEMRKDFQAKILRAIEYGEIQSIGYDHFELVNVRFFATTNRDLKEEVKRGNFREDLFYRISSVVIKIPPLRERKEDIIPIFEHYLNYFKEKYEIKKEINFEKDFYKKLLEYPFYGNIRELKSATERIILLRKKIIKFDEIFFKVKNEDTNHLPLKEATIKFQSNYIKKFLEECKGNKAEVCRLLKISRKKLYSILKIKNE